MGICLLSVNGFLLEQFIGGDIEGGRDGDHIGVSDDLSAAHQSAELLFRDVGPFGDLVLLQAALPDDALCVGGDNGNGQIITLLLKNL